MAPPGEDRRIGLWERMGFNVQGLRETLASGDAEPAEVLTRFEDLVRRSVRLEAELVRLASGEFELEAEEIRSMVTDPRRLGEARRRVEYLKEWGRLHEKEEGRRGQLKNRIEKLAQEGYVVDPLRGKADGDLDALELALSEVEDAVVVLTDLTERLNGLDPTADPIRLIDTRRMLRDPSRVAEAMAEVEDLEKRLPHL